MSQSDFSKYSNSGLAAARSGQSALGLNALKGARIEDSRRVGALRILKTKSGEHRLQHYVRITSDDGHHSKTVFAWQDIPIVEEDEDDQS